jgi:hypothetical protein
VLPGEEGVNPARLRAGDVRQSIPASQLPAFHIASARLLDELDGRRQLASD